jgi:PAS domain S-box-containing protein
VPSNATRILVVDDNPATLYSTSRILRSAGWTVLEAATGNEGLALASQGVDAVMLDVNLPDIDGFEICRILRSQEKTARTPVIHLSATFVKDVDKVQGLEAGADGYLTHPIEPPVLIATVNAFLRTREAEKEWHRSEGEYIAVFENALNGIFLISRDLAFVKANPAMCRLLQQPHDKIVGRPILDFVPHDRRAEAGEIFKRLEQDKAWRGVFALERADGHAVHLESNLSEYSVSDIWLAVVSDISGRPAPRRSGRTDSRMTFSPRCPTSCERR